MFFYHVFCETKCYNCLTEKLNFNECVPPDAKILLVCTLSCKINLTVYTCENKRRSLYLVRFNFCEDVLFDTQFMIIIL